MKIPKKKWKLVAIGLHHSASPCPACKKKYRTFRCTKATLFKVQGVFDDPKSPPFGYVIKCRKKTCTAIPLMSPKPSVRIAEIEWEKKCREYDEQK